MVDLIFREWKEQKIRHREDGKMCLTDMSKSEGKLFGNWYQLKDTQEFLKILSDDIGIPITAEQQGSEALIEIIKGGKPEEQGTWGIPEVTLEYARWLNKRLAIQCNRWNIELLEKGKVELQQHPENPSSLDAIQAYLNQTQLLVNRLFEQEKQLENHDERIDKNEETIETTALEVDNLKERIEDYRKNPLANNYFKITINQYCNMNNLDTSKGQTISVGRSLTRMCSILEIEFNQTPEGRSNEYPYWLLKALFDTVEEFNVDFLDLVQKYINRLES